MSSPIFSMTAALIFSMGLYGLIVLPHPLRKVIALNVMGSSIFLFFVVMAGRAPDPGDPVPHAMVLTGIVVTVGVTGLAVGLARRIALAPIQSSRPENER